MKQNDYFKLDKKIKNSWVDEILEYVNKHSDIFHLDKDHLEEFNLIDIEWYELDEQLMNYQEFYKKENQLISLGKKVQKLLPACYRIDLRWDKIAKEYGCKHGFLLNKSMLNEHNDKYFKIYNYTITNPCKLKSFFGNEEYDDMTKDGVVYFNRINGSLTLRNGIETEDGLDIRNTKPFFGKQLKSYERLCIFEKMLLKHWPLSKELIENDDSCYTQFTFSDVFHAHNKRELFKNRNFPDFKYQNKISLFDSYILKLIKPRTTKQFYRQIYQEIINHYRNKSNESYFSEELPFSPDGYFSLPRKGTYQYSQQILILTLIRRSNSHFGIEVDLKKHSVYEIYRKIQDIFWYDASHDGLSKNHLFEYNHVTYKGLVNREEHLIHEEQRRYREFELNQEKELKKQHVKQVNSYKLPKWGIQLENLPADYRILRSQLEMKSEGNQMSNCVGGYYYEVRNGDSIIFHQEKFNSTIEICFNESDKKIVINQVFGFGNQSLTTERLEKIKTDFKVVLGYKPRILIS